MNNFRYKPNILPMLLLLLLLPLHNAGCSSSGQKQKPGATNSGSIPTGDDNSIKRPALLKNKAIFKFSGYRLPSESDEGNKAAGGDIDGDGDNDIIIANSGRNHIYINDGKGSFTDGQGLLPENNAASKDLLLFDADGDGDLDIFFVNDSALNRLYINNGAGRFEDETLLRLPSEAEPGTPGRGADTGDLDGDGDIDIVIANHNIQISIYLNINGKFDTASAGIPDARYLTNAVSLIDLDNDDDLDIVLANNGQNRIYINDGSAGFIDETVSRIPADNDNTVAIAANTNGANGVDLITGNRNGSIKYYENNGAGFFTEVFNRITDTPIELNDLLLFDPDADGDLDLAAATQNENRIFINTNGIFEEQALLTPVISEPTYGLLAIEADGDRSVDLVAVNNDQQNRLYINNGTGFFNDLTMAVLPPDYDRNLDTMVGDMDNDGDLDLLLPDFGVDKLYLNNGKGNFIDVSATHMPWDGGPDDDISCDATVGDLDGDGWPDIFITNFHAQQDRLLINNGDGSFKDMTNTHLPSDSNSAHDADIADLDGDGDLDIVVPNDLGGPTSIFLNNGSGFFTDGTGIVIDIIENNSFAGRIGDFDSDGDMDIVVSNSKKRTRLYLNRIKENGMLFFEDVTVTNMPDDAQDDTKDVSIGDVDGDGDLDMVLGNFGQRTRLYLNDGTGHYSDVTETRLPDDTGNLTTRSQFTDLDLNGYPDIFLSNVGQNMLYLNDGTGHYTDVTATHLPADTDSSTGSDVGDFNGDGYPDIIVSNQDQQNRVYFNTGVR